MRHGKKINHLGRTSAHRQAMLSNMATSLISHKRITTTVAKAKALKKYVEPLLTKAKNDSTHSRRVVFSRLRDKHSVTELFREISQKIADRPGGYTRILRTGFRSGDGAEMCIIELVDYNENYSQSKDAKKTKEKTTRRGRSKKVEKEEKQVIKTSDSEVEEKQAQKENKAVEVPKEETQSVDKTNDDTQSTDKVTEEPKSEE